MLSYLFVSEDSYICPRPATISWFQSVFFKVWKDKCGFCRAALYKTLLSGDWPVKHSVSGFRTNHFLSCQKFQGGANRPTSESNIMEKDKRKCATTCSSQNTTVVQLKTWAYCFLPAQFQLPGSIIIQHASAVRFNLAKWISGPHAACSAPATLYADSSCQRGPVGSWCIPNAWLAVSMCDQYAIKTH